MNPILTLPLKSGLNEQDTIGADELLTARDVSYDEDGILSVRRGTAKFGNPIPDTIVVLNNCDADTNWVASNDADAVSEDAATQRRGVKAVQFNIDVSKVGDHFATLTNAALGTIDIEDEKGHLGFWLFVPTGFNTNFTSIRVRLGSDSSNYYEWESDDSAEWGDTPEELTENIYNFIKLNYADSDTTGSPDDTSIDYFQIHFIYESGYIDQTALRIDDIQSYSLIMSPWHSFGLQ